MRRFSLKYPLLAVIAVLASVVMLISAGCDGTDEKKNNPGDSDITIVEPPIVEPPIVEPPIVEPPIVDPSSELDPANWQDSIKGHDPALITGENIWDSEHVWANAGGLGGVWVFTSARETGMFGGVNYRGYARKYNPAQSGQEDYFIAYDWHTHDNKLYIIDSRPTYGDKIIYRYEISAAGVLTLLDVAGTRIAFNKVRATTVL